MRSLKASMMKGGTEANQNMREERSTPCHERRPHFVKMLYGDNRCSDRSSGSHLPFKKECWIQLFFPPSSLPNRNSVDALQVALGSIFSLVPGSSKVNTCPTESWENTETLINTRLQSEQPGCHLVDVCHILSCHGPYLWWQSLPCPTLMTMCLGGWGSTSLSRVCSIHLLRQLSRVPTCPRLFPTLLYLLKKKPNSRKMYLKVPLWGLQR